MKALIVFVACAGIAVGQTTPGATHKAPILPLQKVENARDLQTLNRISDYCKRFPNVNLISTLTRDGKQLLVRCSGEVIIDGESNFPPAPKPDAVTPAKDTSFIGLPGKAFPSGFTAGTITLAPSPHQEVRIAEGCKDHDMFTLKIPVSGGVYEEVNYRCLDKGWVELLHRGEIDSVTPETTFTDEDLIRRRNEQEMIEAGREHVQNVQIHNNLTPETTQNDKTFIDPVEAAKSGWSCTMTPKSISCVK